MTPCADFFLRSKSHSNVEDSTQNKVENRGEKNFSDLNCAIQLGMTLIILWKVRQITLFFCDNYTVNKKTTQLKIIYLYM